MSKVDATVDHWASRRDAAQELTVILGYAVSINTLRDWGRQPGCPLPHGSGPIPRDSLIQWAQSRPGPGAPRKTGGNDSEGRLRVQLLEEQVRNLQGKNAKLYEESVNAAEARAGVVRAVEELKRTLLEEVPSRSWAESQGKTLDEAAPAIRQLIAAALNEFHRRGTAP